MGDTRVLQSCYRVVTEVIHGFSKCAIGMTKGLYRPDCYRGVRRDVTGVLNRSYMGFKGGVTGQGSEKSGTDLAFKLTESYIRKEKYRPATTTPTPATAVSHSGDPPWILKQAGLESSGQRLISSIGKTKRIAFLFFRKKKKIKKRIF